MESTNIELSSTQKSLLERMKGREDNPVLSESEREEYIKLRYAVLKFMIESHKTRLQLQRCRNEVLLSAHSTHAQITFAAQGSKKLEELN